MIGNPLKVINLIAELSNHGIVVPEIQRSYVWKRAQIAKLLDSIYRGYPTGSILLWDTLQPIQSREMATSLGKDMKPDFIPKIVLDGQQRITSLAKVFDRSTPKQERIIFNVVDEVFEPYSPRNANDPRWLDVTEFFTGGLNELDILDRLEDAGVVQRTGKELRDKLHDRLKRLSAIKDYQFPVEIVKEDNLEVVTEVFIRVNSGGTRLREAELALARLAWKLPGSIVGPFEMMEDACEERGFVLDARFLMRALVSVATGQSRFKDLKAFWQRPAKEIEEAWSRTERGIKLALDFVEGNVGIPGSELLPSHFTLFPLIGVFSVRDNLTAAEENSLRRWFLIANAFSRYAGSPETFLNQDLSLLGAEMKNISGLLDLALKDLRSEPIVTAEDLDKAGTNSPFFHLAFLAIMRREPSDWFRGIRIRRDSFSEDQQIEYHHIFPKKWLNERNVDRFSRDEMANLAFLAQKANRKISSKKPIEYLSDIEPKRLEAQLLPMDKDLWDLDRYSDFLVMRRKLLADAMNMVLEA